MKSMMRKSLLSDLTYIQNGFNSRSNRLDEVYPHLKSFFESIIYLGDQSITLCTKMLIIIHNWIWHCWYSSWVRTSIYIFNILIWPWVFIIELSKPSQEMVSIVIGLCNNIYSRIYSVSILPKCPRETVLLDLTKSPCKLLKYIIEHSIITK
jgi:hypothetical protein